jgi:hypothetical protein
VSAFATPDWTTFQSNGLTYYTANYTMTLLPGERHLLAFYTSGKNLANAVPEPTPALALLPAIALVARRRRSKARIG